MSPGDQPQWARYDARARRLTLTLHVQPNARRSGIAGQHGEALKVRIAAPAADNKANAELVGFLSVVLAVPKAAVLIRHGAAARRKVVEISGGPEVLERLAGLAGDRAHPLT